MLWMQFNLPWSHKNCAYKEKKERRTIMKLEPEIVDCYCFSLEL